MAVQEFEHKRARDPAELLKIAVSCTIDELQLGPGDPVCQQPCVSAGVDFILATVNDQGGSGSTRAAPGCGAGWPSRRARRPTRGGRWTGLPAATAARQSQGSQNTDVCRLGWWPKAWEVGAYRIAPDDEGYLVQMHQMIF